MTTTALAHDFTPRGVCREVFGCRDPEVLVSGPAGTGKSRACLEKLHAMALANPRMRGLMVRKTAASLTSTALVTWKRDVIPEALETGVVEYYGGSRAEPAQYRYANGSRIEIGGMDKSTKIMSSEYDIVYVQEGTELTEDDWESITTRLRSNVVSFQQIIADTNPHTPTHWLKQRCNRGITTLYESRHEDNPTIYRDDGTLTESGIRYMATLDRLTGTRYQRLRLGLWVGAEGIIYPEYDPAIHLVDPYPIPADWARWWSIDFGFVNPFCCQHWAEKPDGELVLYREWYGTHQLVSEWGEQILDHVTNRTGDWVDTYPTAIICDHDAEGRATFERIVGHSTVPAIKRVSDGIQAVQQRLKTERLEIMRGALVKPDDRLVADARPTCTTEEFGSYIWADSKLKEVPVKVDDHGLDALRYLVAQRDLGTRPGIRWLD